MNRKLIRPNLSEIKDKMKNDLNKKRLHPPTDTFAENYYYLKQMNKKTSVAVVMADGEVLEGSIEWYDRNCIKLNRENAPNLLLFKGRIKYIYKLDEGKEAADTEPEKRNEDNP